MSALRLIEHDNGRRTDLPLVSVIINNYNYAAYLGGMRSIATDPGLLKRSYRRRRWFD